MKSILKITVLIAAAFWLSATVASAQTKIGVIDLRKVFESYYKKVQTDDTFKKEAESMENERTDMITAAKKTEDDWRKLIDNANDQAVSADERSKAKALAEEKSRDLANQQAAIQDYDKTSIAKLQEEKRNKRDILVGEIREHLNALAKAAGYNLVVDTSGESANMIPVAVYANGLPDLTESLIKDLNAGAPASLSASPASSSTTGLNPTH